MEEYINKILITIEQETGKSITPEFAKYLIGMIQEVPNLQQNKSDKKSWELTEEEMENVDPRKAVENLKENNGNEDRTPDELGPIIE